MRSHSLVLAPLAALALLSAATRAQRVFTVDLLNRPGANFTDLPAAEAAARDGDVIRVRGDAGNYSGFTTSKGITITAEVGDFHLGPNQAIQVAGLPAGRDFVLARCLATTSGLGPSLPVLELLNCQGRVQLERLDMSSYTNRGTIEVTNCVAVTMRDTRILSGNPSLLIQGSMASLVACQIQGMTASPQPPIPAGEGVSVQNSIVSLAWTQITGGGGGGPTIAPAPAMSVTGAVVIVGGDVGRLTAGYYGTRGGSAPVSAVVGQAGVVRMDPSTIVEPHGGAPAFQGVVGVTVPVPALLVTGGRVVNVSDHPLPGAATVTLFGLPMTPVFSGAFQGSLWLDPATLIAVPGVPGGFLNSSVPPGVSVVLQVANILPSGVELSNPGVISGQ